MAKYHPAALSRYKANPVSGTEYVGNSSALYNVVPRSLHFLCNSGLRCCHYPGRAGTSFATVKIAYYRSSGSGSRSSRSFPASRPALLRLQPWRTPAASLSSVSTSRAPTPSAPLKELSSCSPTWANAWVLSNSTSCLGRHRSLSATGPGHQSCLPAATGPVDRHPHASSG